MNLRTLSFLFAFFLMAGTAQAVTLTPGTSYSLGGTVTGYSINTRYNGLYNVLGTSTLTVNADNSISAVINLLQPDGDTATLRIDKLLMTGTGVTKTLTAPRGAGIKVYPSGCVDIGSFTTADGNVVDFTISTGSGAINTNTNIFSISSTTYYALNPAMTYLGRVGFSLTIGNATGGTNVPEPMSMTLLGLGLLGGVVSRKKKLSA